MVLGPLPGLYLVPEFVTEEEEAELLRCLDSPEGGGQGPPAAAGAAARAAAGPASPWQHSTFNGNCDSQSFGVITERGADPHVRACRPHHGEREIPPYMCVRVCGVCACPALASLLSLCTCVHNARYANLPLPPPCMCPTGGR